MVSSLIHVTFLVNFVLIVAGAVLPRVPAGTQFITGPCTSDADCASGCCGFNTSKCAGAIIALEHDGGCGFGSGTPNDDAAQAMGHTGGITSKSNGDATAPAPASSPASVPATMPAKATGTQFITGPCASDADCASGCCGFNTGKCAGAIIALEHDGGCGFGSGTPNDNAAQAMGHTGGITSISNSGASPGPASPASNSGSNPTKATGTQFITGACSSDADCVSGCCGFRTGKCAGAIVALQRDGGCGFGSGTPNDDAAQAMGFKGGITS
ncbi:hypothetical protein C8R43DRAFT_1236760 [Mycena crocata]|nr:hypothetical protein C8R43DRAFT_1236760 [Mycena crocata]